MACGSGGTAAGLALGLHLCPDLNANLHAYGVCDNPEYFYNYMDSILSGMGATHALSGETARDLLTCHQAKGSGYAISTEAELALAHRVALDTGIILDPVYGGKALYGLIRDMEAAPEEWEGRRLLFVHTGGLFGTYDKAQQLQPMVEATERVGRFDF